MFRAAKRNPPTILEGQTERMSRYEVVIVGAGVAGAAAAYHLSLVTELSDNSVCILEAGVVGRGSQDGIPLVPHAQISSDDLADVVGGMFTYAQSSGTAVFENPAAAAIKMIVNVFPCSADTYISNFGEEGARSYLRLAHKGLELEKKLASSLLEDPSSQLTCEGSLYVCLEEDVDAFTREYQLLQYLGAKSIELWDKSRTQFAAGDGFSLGIYFPDDAVIDSSSYAAGLIRSAVASGKVRLIDNSSPVVSVETKENEENSLATTKLKNGEIITSAWVVLATGGLFMDPHLAGILTPCWSYLVAIPEPPLNEAAKEDNAFRLKHPNSLNFFSWGFTHDWCLTKGNLRCSGEDHFSAFKPPKSIERCKRLAEWTVEKLSYLKLSENEYESRYGVYSETPDHSPLVGTTHPSSRVCYLLGCNAWGQAVLSFAASLVPALLGMAAMAKEDEEDFKVLNIRRFALLNSVLDK